jgi:aminopeptidase
MKEVVLMDKLNLEKYARLIVKTGVNIKKNQICVISAPVENYEFVEMIAEMAYQEGAREVVPNWIDERIGRSKYEYAPDDVFDEIPEYRKMFYLETVRKDACYIRLAGSDPDILKGIDQNKIMRTNRTFGENLKEYRERLMSDKNVWCVAAAPTKAWAKKVFPNLSQEDAVEKLWDAIFMTNRIDKEDPVAAWDVHKNNLKKRMAFLNDNHFKYLKYSNSLGTDLNIELPEKHIWLGGQSFMKDGTEFMANLPTEEVFTLPKKDGVNGMVHSTKPLVYNGVLIEDFWLRLEAGKVVEYDAKNGVEALKSLIDLDEGSCYLGEVALVPYHSPISEMNILFYNTLFDENASCHLALGEAYPICIEGGESMSKEDLVKNGKNDSIAHEDFMVGSSDLRITGVKDSGEEVIVFENGDFAFENKQ